MFTHIFCVNQFKTSKGYMSIYIYSYHTKGISKCDNKAGYRRYGNKDFYYSSIYNTITVKLRCYIEQAILRCFLTATIV